MRIVGGVLHSPSEVWSWEDYTKPPDWMPRLDVARFRHLAMLLEPVEAAGAIRVDA